MDNFSEIPTEERKVRKPKKEKPVRLRKVNKKFIYRGYIDEQIHVRIKDIRIKIWGIWIVQVLLGIVSLISPYYLVEGFIPIRLFFVITIIVAIVATIFLQKDHPNRKNSDFFQLRTSSDLTTEQAKKHIDDETIRVKLPFSRELGLGDVKKWIPGGDNEAPKNERRPSFLGVLTPSYFLVNQMMIYAPMIYATNVDRTVVKKASEKITAYPCNEIKKFSVTRSKRCKHSVVFTVITIKGHNYRQEMRANLDDDFSKTMEQLNKAVDGDINYKKTSGSGPFGSLGYYESITITLPI